MSMTSIWTGVWAALLVWRIAWTCWPQPGYIHPDEFFQSSEIVIGDVLKLEVERTWEFNPLNPIRSMLLPYGIYGFPLELLRHLESYASIKITPYLLLVIPRLIITLLMFAVDIVVWKSCKYLHINPMIGLVLYASSFVTLTFLTRTLSNTIECLFFAIVVLIVIKRMPSSAEGKRKKKGGQKGGNNLQSGSEPKAKGAKQPQQNPQNAVTAQQHSSGQASKKNKKNRKNKGNQNANKQQPPPQHTKPNPAPTEDRKKAEKRTEEQKVKKQQQQESSPKTPSSRPHIHHLELSLLAACLVAGTFNRPTFPIFSITPTLLWIYYVSSHKPSIMLKNAALLLVYAVPFALVFVVSDSLYYRTTISNFNDNMYNCINKKDQENMITCMWNTVVQNTVITPLNFIYYNINDVNLAKHGLHPFYLHAVVNMPLLYGILYLLFMYNIYLYLINDHPFNNVCWLLLFVINPVDVLTIFPHQEPRFLVPLLPVMILVGASVLERLRWKKTFATLWIVSNVLLATFYGVLHQGGLMHSLFQIQKASESNSEPGLDHAIFYHTYMPPRHLLLNRKPNKTLIAHDLQGSNLSRLNQVVAFLQSTNDTRSLSVVLPSTVANDFKQTLHTHSSIIAELTFGPHLSLEDPPPLFPFLETSWDNIQKVLSHLHLKLLRLAPKE